MTFDVQRELNLRAEAERERAIPVDDPGLVHDLVHDLDDSPPEYIRHVASGVACIKYGVLFQLIFGLASRGASAIQRNPRLNAGFSPAALTVLELLAAAFALGATILAAVGWARATVADPTLPERYTMGRQRNTLRTLYALSIGINFSLLGCVFAMQLLAQRAPNTVSTGFVVLFVLSLVAALANLGVLLAQIWIGLRYFGWLVARAGFTPALERIQRAPLIITLYMTVGAIVLVGPLLATIRYYGILGLVQNVLNGAAATSGHHPAPHPGPPPTPDPPAPRVR